MADRIHELTLSINTMNKEFIVRKFFSEERDQETSTQFFQLIDSLLWQCIYEVGIPPYEQDDFHSDICEKLLRMKPKHFEYRGSERFDGWLYRVVTNTYYHQVRDNRHWDVSMAEGYDVPEEEADPYEQERIFEAMQEGMEQLSEAHRSTLHKHYWEKKKAPEICQELNIQRSTMYKRLDTAQEQLREYLRKKRFLD